MDETLRSEFQNYTSSSRSYREQLKTKTDAALVERVLVGDEAAFRVLAQRYAPMVLGYAYGKISHDSDREDVMQEVFLAAYSNLKKLRKPDRFGPWLMKIVRYKVADFHRFQYRQPKVADIEESTDTIENALLSERAIENPGPFEHASQAETVKCIRDAIGMMGDTYRTVLYMRLIA